MGPSDDGNRARDGLADRRGPLDPDPEAWAVLNEGNRLLEVLRDFYTRVYADERLAPFFERVTKQHVIDKQYSFLHAKLTGKDVYFGDRPRNAHHWMVISDELFDYRESLLARCLREHGLPEAIVEHIRAIDETFRKQIVKSVPRCRKLEGIELPLDGYAEIELALAYLCDGCKEPIECGETVVYHRRIGVTHCERCAHEKHLVPIGAAD